MGYDRKFESMSNYVANFTVHTKADAVADIISVNSRLIAEFMMNKYDDDDDVVTLGVRKIFQE